MAEQSKIRYSNRTKHIEISKNFFEDWINKRVILLKHIDTKYQTADILTKLLIALIVLKYLSSLGIKEVLTLS